MSTDQPAFIRGNDRLNALLADPDTARDVAAIKEEMAQQDRAHAMGLSTIRQAANLTQSELAQRLGVKQSSVSQMEARNDPLLSTFAKYLTAAGASDVTITARIGDHDITWTLADDHQQQ